MVNAEESPTSLLLAGYLPLKRNGFALPCFATAPRANTWYTAVSTTEGDHLSSVAAFEVYDGGGVHPLPDLALRPVVIGDPWIDVFLWDGTAHAGTPSEIWQSVAPWRAALETRAPLSLFELCEDGAPGERQQLASRAVSYLAARLGDDVAGDWGLSVIRSDLQRFLRRRLPAAREASARLADLKVKLRFGGVTIVLPPKVAEALFSHPNCEAWLAELRERAEDLGRDIVDLVAMEDASEDEEIAVASTDDADELELLVLTAGRRAQEIARLISSPEWTPEWPDRRHDQRRRRGRFAEVHSLEDEWPDGDYSAVVVLADDGAIDAGISEFEHIRGRLGRPTPILLAPALPRYGVSRLLTNERERQALPPGVDALVDTSLARSPFWIAGKRRAVDRSIADIVVGSGQLMGAGSPIREFLLERRGKEMPLLQHSAGGAGVVDGVAYRLISESSAAGPGEAILETVFTSWDAKGRLGEGAARLVKAEPDFPRFVEALLIARGGRALIPNASHPDSPVDATQGLAGLHAVLYDTPVGRVIVSSDTPTIENLQRAHRDEWWLARYTDDEALKLVVNGGPIQGDRLPVPGEIHLGPIERLSTNRNIARRGVDIRDVIPLTAGQHEDWVRSGPDPKFARFVRPYRNAISWNNPRLRPASEAAFVAHAPELLEAEELGEVSARVIRQVTEWRNPRQTRGSWPKRQGDLEAAYAETPPGCRRFVVSDGDLPIQLSSLEDDEVPVQKLFMVVGDEAVPALMLSRVFEVWARATRSNSRGWSSRFSLTWTFEGFPLHGGFFLRRQGPDTVALTVDRDSQLGDACRRFEEMLRRTRKWPSARSRPIDRSQLDPVDLHHLLDVPLMGLYDLPPDSGDLEILERLVAFNRRPGQPGFILGRSHVGDLL